MNLTNIAAITQIVSAVVLVVTAVILWMQISETRHATYVTAFKAVYDMLQDETKRDDRRVVLCELVKKPFDAWTPQEKKLAERVCHNYDAVGIICRNQLLPTYLIADSWGDSLRRCWKILVPLVNEYRIARNSHEFWDDFEWLAREAEQYQQRITI